MDLAARPAGGDTRSRGSDCRVDEPREDGRRRRWESRHVVALLTIASGVVNLATLSSSSVWLDEAYTYDVARAPWGRFVSDLLYNGGNMMLHTVFLRFWLLVDTSEFWFRLPSALFATRDGAGVLLPCSPDRGRAGLR